MGGSRLGTSLIIPANMPLQLTHTFDSHVEVSRGGQVLFRYVYEPRTDPFETPKPYFHPVHTLAGNRVTNFRPHDHLWHYGIAMTFAHVSAAGKECDSEHGGHGEAQNFWGGNSYIHGQGYQRLPHLVGRQQHRAWHTMRCDDSGVFLEHQITWSTFQGDAWFDETRSVAVPQVEPASGFWTLDLATSLRNVAGAPLSIGSPTTAGRPLAGYGGLMWRGPRSFLKGAILASGDLDGPEVMGQRAPWLAYVGKHDGTDGNSAAASSQVNQSTVVFIDQPANPRYPTQWFVRNDPFAAASFAVTFDEHIVVQPEESLTLRYRIIFADGAWTREQIERVA